MLPLCESSVRCCSADLSDGNRTTWSVHLSQAKTCIAPLLQRVRVDQLLTNRARTRRHKKENFDLFTHPSYLEYGEQSCVSGPFRGAANAPRGKLDMVRVPNTPSIHGGFCVDPRRRGTQRHLMVCFVCSRNQSSPEPRVLLARAQDTRATGPGFRSHLHRECKVVNRLDGPHYFCALT